MHSKKLDYIITTNIEVSPIILSNELYFDPQYKKAGATQSYYTSSFIKGCKNGFSTLLLFYLFPPAFLCVPKDKRSVSHDKDL